MSDLVILYRVAEGGPFNLQVDNGVTIENITDDLVNARVLIPDTRLQAIKDAPRCEHDRIDRHQVTVKNDDGEDIYYPNGAVMWEWCEGAPELRDLLTALTEENNND
ncbi:hypothetical protein LCGC14_2641210 [marine sediment metagenome]|uniref:Uncharacterized protein n=1 Tax=marine sediment metagenome TaxID=412755 RepID=A0A0F9C870_9ZZZZ